VLAALLLALVIAGVGIWRTKAFSDPLRSFTSTVGVPRTSLSHERAPRAITLPVERLTLRAELSTLALPAAAANAARELLGSGDGSIVSWSSATGLWGESNPAAWWQSALDLYALVRYLEQANNTQAQYQQVIETTFARNVSLPGTNMPRNFANEYMDDTAWWGLAWLEAARYELRYQHDVAEARRFFAVAEWDANYIYSSPRPCHQLGIEWQVDYPPDTITNAQFVALAAQLSSVTSTPGPLYDPTQSQVWLGDAQRELGWLQASGLVNVRSGVVRDGFNGHCRPVGGALTYTEGEMAEALVRMGQASGYRGYYSEAAAFIDRVLSRRAQMVSGGVLQEPCEARRGLCAVGDRALDSSVYKGLFLNAMADWSVATGATTYDRFLIDQARAVLSNAASDGRTLSSCQTPHDCQIGFYWSRRVNPTVAPMPVSAGTQASGLSALVDAQLAVGS
jgi:hypothetical protein